MPRSTRELSSTGVYHIMMRGNEKRNIFIDDKDRERFLKIINSKNINGEYEIFGYCLMNNHIHLIIKESTMGISKIIKRINISYAQYFNKKYNRIGHVFQDRFKSEAIEDDNYLLCAIRYIHNNPVKAKIVSHPSKYKWSSYNNYISGESNIVSIDFVLSLYSDDIKKAIRNYQNFSLEKNSYEFLDIKEDDDNIIKSESECIQYINKYCEKYNTTLDNILNYKSYKYIRDKLIREVRDNSRLSLRELERIFGLSRSTINRA